MLASRADACVRNACGLRPPGRVCASPDTSAPIPAASPTTTPAPGSTAGPSANGLAHLDQHGISFDYPAAWGNFASVVRPDVGLGARTIAYLIDEEGKIVEAHAKVDPSSYPQTQLTTI